MRGVAERLLGGGVTHERHIGHQQGPAASACHRGAVIHHLIHRDRHRSVVSLPHHAPRIAPPQDLRPRLGEQVCEGRVVRRETGDAFTAAFHLDQGGYRHRRGDGGAAHENSSAGWGLSFCWLLCVWWLCSLCLVFFCLF